MKISFPLCTHEISAVPDMYSEGEVVNFEKIAGGGGGVVLKKYLIITLKFGEIRQRIFMHFNGE